MAHTRFLDFRIPRHRSPPVPVGGKAKRIFDVVAASALIAVMSPMILFVATLVVIGDGWPFYIRHNRIGHGGDGIRLLQIPDDGARRRGAA